MISKFLKKYLKMIFLNISFKYEISYKYKSNIYFDWS